MKKGKTKTWGTSGTDLWNGSITLRLVTGWHVRPIMPPWYWFDRRKQFGSSNDLRAYNCWQGDKPWFVLRFPIIFPFLSICIGKGGFYIGTKVYEHDLQNRIRYSHFLGGWPFGEYLTFSFSARRTR